MSRLIAAGIGTWCGACGVAALDAMLTAGLPILGAFLPIQLYLLGAGLGALIFGAFKWRWWPWVPLASLAGGAGVVIMLSSTPPWHTKVGWRNCGLIAGSILSRSPYPVKMPSCGTLSMCANESRWNMSKAITEQGCPAP